MIVTLDTAAEHGYRRSTHELHKQQKLFPAEQHYVGLVAVSEHIDAKVLRRPHWHQQSHLRPHTHIRMVVFPQIRNIIHR